ncbi:MAG: alpha-galactosidase [Phycisphaerae bacterium]
MKNDLFEIQVLGRAEGLWRYRQAAMDHAYNIAAPTFEVDGKEVRAVLVAVAMVGGPVRLSNGCTEHAYEGVLADDPGLALQIIFRTADGDPVVRFRYVLRSTAPRRLTRTSGRDALEYLAIGLGDLPQAKEVRFSEFQELVHSFCLSELPIEPRQFEDRLCLIGPMIVAGAGDRTMLVAYEHGSQVPDAFLHFALEPDRRVRLRAVKGNYTGGQAIGPDQPFETIWLQFAAVAGDEERLARAYRAFVLRHMTLNAESRKPYIFYNTWAYQERNKWWNHATFLESMREDRILAEIDVAHRMGIEVFVLDTGWFSRTGDWRVNPDRFPNDMKSVREKLAGYGMKLGLWFNPLAAGVNSRMLERHQDCVMTWRGRKPEPSPVWETEASLPMCLVSRYADAFAEELVRLVRELGVTYFKWDAIGQYGCDDPGHDHGGAECSPEERADRYAFEIGRRMIRVVDRLGRDCPEAIVDFDITEGGRFVGLGFLAAGKYFLINNGPYYGNYDIPVGDEWSNIFVYPGPARGWICRTPLSFDKWIPSVLFLTHYLPDDPKESQILNIGSLILGQNGIWGDLLTVSEEGVARFGRLLGLYKQVRGDITESFPVRTGSVGSSPEVHEKISDSTGRGILAIFAGAPGAYSYVTARRVDERFFATDGVAVSLDAAGRAKVDAVFDGPGAKIIFFGVKPS